jgi:hypothetical protein
MQMIVVVQGTNDFDDYQVFLRAMSVALSSMRKDIQTLQYTQLDQQRFTHLFLNFLISQKEA